jgi:hypothetical protein
MSLNRRSLVGKSYSLLGIGLLTGIERPSLLTAKPEAMAMVFVEAIESARQMNEKELQ